MTAFEFFHRVGREPVQDELERTNCPYAGTTFHLSCGRCCHGLPRFLCRTCMALRGIRIFNLNTEDWKLTVCNSYPWAYGYWDDKVARFYEVVVRDAHGTADWFSSASPFGARSPHAPTQEQIDQLKRLVVVGKAGA